MYSKTKNIISLLVILTILVLSLVVYAGDYGNGHWASETLKNWQERGILRGGTAGEISPDHDLTRAEFITLVNRMKGYFKKSDEVTRFSDVDQTDWFYEDVAIALAAGYIEGTSPVTMSPLSPITRQEAMAIMARIENLKPNRDVLLAVKDVASLADWAADDVSACINEGFITGSESRVMPNKNITKAEAIVFLDRLFSNSRVFSFAGTYGGTSSDKVQYGSVKILADGITLKNVNVLNDLKIDKLVADGEVYLEQVAIGGNLIANGGGINSLYFRDVVVDDSLIVAKYDDSIRLHISGNSTFGHIALNSGVIIDASELTAPPINGVEIPNQLVASASVSLTGSFDTVSCNSKDLKIVLDGSVEKFVVKQDITLIGEGKIGSIDCQGGAKVNIGDDQVTSENAAKSMIVMPDLNSTCCQNKSDCKVTDKIDDNDAVDDEDKASVSLREVTIKQKPHKLDYLVGEQLDLTGLVVIGVYSDGTTKQLTIARQNIFGYNANQLGRQEITIIANDKIVRFSVNVGDGGGIPFGAEIVSVATPAALVFENGTALEAIRLPARLNVNYRYNGQLAVGDVAVVWQPLTGYAADRKIGQSLMVDGEIVVPTGVTCQAEIKKVKAEIIVKAATLRVTRTSFSNQRIVEGYPKIVMADGKISFKIKLKPSYVGTFGPVKLRVVSMPLTVALQADQLFNDNALNQFDLLIADGGEYEIAVNEVLREEGWRYVFGLHDSAEPDPNRFILDKMISYGLQ